MEVDNLLEERRQWYMNNEFKEYNGVLPPFIELRLDTMLRSDRGVLEWISSRECIMHQISDNTGKTDCGAEFIPYYQFNYCPKCGKKLKFKY